MMLRTLGHLREALLGPQFRWIVLFLASWGWLLEPHLIQRLALHGGDGWPLQTPIFLDPVILQMICLCRAGGVIGSPDVTLAQELERGSVGSWV